LSDDLDESPPEQTPDDIFLTAVLFESGLGLLALLLGWMIGPDARAMVPSLTAENGWLVGKGILYGCLAAVPLLAFIEIVRRIPVEAVRELDRLGEDGMIQLLLQLRPAELVLISVCAGVGEELLFRGWLMYWLASGSATPPADPSTMEMGIAMVGSAIAFGLVHPITKLYIFLAALMGLYFGALVLLTGNLLVPIAAHAAYDAVQLLVAARRNRIDAQLNS